MQELFYTSNAACIFGMLLLPQGEQKAAASSPLIQHKLSFYFVSFE